MRRIFAILLLMLFSLPLIASAMAAAHAAESPLPPCCRKDGKHDCARKPSATTAVSLAAFSDPCPHAPGGSQASTETPFAGPGMQPAASFPAARALTAPHQHLRAHFHSYTSPKRGPPALL